MIRLSASTRRTVARRSTLRYASMPTGPGCHGAPTAFAAGRGLPAVVDEPADPSVVQAADLLLQPGRDRCDARRGGVGPGLFDVAGAGDDGGHAGLVDDPPQRQLGRGHALRREGGELLRGGDPGFEVDAGERLPHVERLAVAVVVAVVVGGEGGVLGVAA